MANTDTLAMATDIAPALTNLARLRAARAAAAEADYERLHVIADAAEMYDEGKSLREILAFVFDAGFTEGRLRAPDAAPSYELLATLLAPANPAVRS